MRLTCGILTHNDEKYLLRCMETLTSQTGLGELGTDWQIVIRDNASAKTDYLTTAKQKYPHIEWILSDENAGFGRGHNDIIRKFPANYHAVLNNDILFEPDFFAKILHALETHEECGSAIGKLLWWDFGGKTEKTDMIDSVGISVTGGHAFSDLGQGEMDRGQYDDTHERFGGSGAAVMYRRSALEEVAYQTANIPRVGRPALLHENDEKKRERDFVARSEFFATQSNSIEYFDETMFMYKEDCDLAERLIAIGKPCLYVPEARAWHDRTASARLPRAKRSERERLGSAAHQTWIIRKHLVWLPWHLRLRVILREIIRWKYLIIFEPRIAWKAMRLLWKKRKEATERRRQTKHGVPFSSVQHLFRT